VLTSIGPAAGIGLKRSSWFQGCHRGAVQGHEARPVCVQVLLILQGPVRVNHQTFRAVFSQTSLSPTRARKRNWTAARAINHITCKRSWRKPTQNLQDSQVRASLWSGSWRGTSSGGDRSPLSRVFRFAEKNGHAGRNSVCPMIGPILCAGPTEVIDVEI